MEMLLRKKIIENKRDKICQEGIKKPFINDDKGFQG